MAGLHEERQMRTPAWKWEWNLNTVVILLGFIGTIAAYGAAWERITSRQGDHAMDIERLDKRVTALEAASRTLDNHELRISNVEKQATDAATAMRAVEAALNGLAADMKVTREILQRIEAAQSRPIPP